MLCSDTFSRSDILKRHFQKCSIRRGNPTGATHLSSPSAYNKNNTNRKASTVQSSAPEIRPATSDSESANSTEIPAPTGSFDHHPEMSLGGVESSQTRRIHTSGLNGVPTSIGDYGNPSMHASPLTTPDSARAPMGFYANASFGPLGAPGFAPPNGQTRYAPNGYSDT